MPTPSQYTPSRAWQGPATLASWPPPPSRGRSEPPRNHCKARVPPPRKSCPPSRAWQGPTTLVSWPSPLSRGRSEPPRSKARGPPPRKSCPPQPGPSPPPVSRSICREKVTVPPKVQTPSAWPCLLLSVTAVIAIVLILVRTLVPAQAQVQGHRVVDAERPTVRPVAIFEAVRPVARHIGGIAASPDPKEPSIPFFSSVVSLAAPASTTPIAVMDKREVVPESTPNLISGLLEVLGPPKLPPLPPPPSPTLPRLPQLTKPMLKSARPVRPVPSALSWHFISATCAIPVILLSMIGSSILLRRYSKRSGKIYPPSSRMNDEPLAATVASTTNRVSASEGDDAGAQTFPGSSSTSTSPVRAPLAPEHIPPPVDGLDPPAPATPIGDAPHTASTNSALADDIEPGLCSTLTASDSLELFRHKPRTHRLAPNHDVVSRIVTYAPSAPPGDLTVKGSDGLKYKHKHPRSQEHQSEIHVESSINSPLDSFDDVFCGDAGVVALVFSAEQRTIKACRREEPTTGRIRVTQAMGDELANGVPYTVPKAAFIDGQHTLQPQRRDDAIARRVTVGKGVRDIPPLRYGKRDSDDDIYHPSSSAGANTEGPQRTEADIKDRWRRHAQPPPELLPIRRRPLSLENDPVPSDRCRAPDLRNNSTKQPVEAGIRHPEADHKTSDARSTFNSSRPHRPLRLDTKKPRQLPNRLLIVTPPSTEDDRFSSIVSGQAPDVRLGTTRDDTKEQPADPDGGKRKIRRQDHGEVNPVRPAFQPPRPVDPIPRLPFHLFPNPHAGPDVVDSPPMNRMAFFIPEVVSERSASPVISCPTPDLPSLPSTSDWQFLKEVELERNETRHVDEVPPRRAATKPEVPVAGSSRPTECGRSAGVMPLQRTQDWRGNRRADAESRGLAAAAKETHQDAVKVFSEMRAKEGKEKTEERDVEREREREEQVKAAKERDERARERAEGEKQRAQRAKERAERAKERVERANEKGLRRQCRRRGGVSLGRTPRSII